MKQPGSKSPHYLPGRTFGPRENGERARRSASAAREGGPVILLYKSGDPRGKPLGRLAQRNPT